MYKSGTRIVKHKHEANDIDYNRFVSVWKNSNVITNILVAAGPNTKKDLNGSSAKVVPVRSNIKLKGKVKNIGTSAPKMGTRIIFYLLSIELSINAVTVNVKIGTKIMKNSSI